MVENVEQHMRFESRLLVGGVFSPQDIKTVLLDEDISVPDRLRSSVEEAWKPKEERGWKPLQLVSLYSYQLHDGRLEQVFKRTNGKDFIGASNWNSWKEAEMELDLESIPNPLVTSSVVVTADNKMIIQLRGESSHQSGNIDALGGHIDIDKDVNRETKEVDLFGAASREVDEEVGLTRRHITDVKCLGLVYNFHDTSHYAMPFVFRTSLTSQEVLELKRSEEETSQVRLMVVDPSRIRTPEDDTNVFNVIREYYPNVDPEARITIILSMAYMEGISKPSRVYADENKIKEIYSSI